MKPTASAAGLVWAAVAAATLQRFMTHTVQRVNAFRISGQKMVKATNPVLFDRLKVLTAHRSRRFRNDFDAALNYLATNAQCAHPQRERRDERQHLRLETVGLDARVFSYRPALA